MIASPAADHWAATCERLADLGRRLAIDGAAEADLERFEHLVDQVVVWLGWSVFHADPTRPFFHRHNDLVSQWGGPNADNVYRHARIEPNRRYVVRGRMHGCDEFLLAVRAGFMHRPVWGTLAQLTASDLGIGPGDEFELHVGGDHPDAVGLPAIREQADRSRWPCRDRHRRLARDRAGDRAPSRVARRACGDHRTQARPPTGGSR